MSVNSELELDISNDFDNNMEKSENLDVPRTNVIKEIMSLSICPESSKKTEKIVSNKKSVSKKQVSDKKPKKSSIKKTIKKSSIKPIVKKPKKSVFIPSETVKSHFSPNFFIGFVNSYYRNIFKKLSFVKYKDGKTLIGSKTLDLNNLEIIDRIRKYIETDQIDHDICDPYLFTSKHYFDEHQKTQDIIDLCKNFMISDANVYDLDKLIDQVSEISSSNKLEARVFNYVFGPVYAEKHKDQSEVHLRYIQRAPEDLMDLLRYKNKQFRATLDQFFDPSKKSLMYKYINGSRLNGQEVLNYVKNKTKEKKGMFASMKKSEIIEKYKLHDLTTSGVQDEINKMQKVVSTVQTAYNFMKYLSEIDNYEIFEKLYNKVEENVERFKIVASDIKKIQALSQKTSSYVEKWKYLIAMLVEFGSAYRYVIPDSDEKRGIKEPISTVFSYLKKNDCFLSISKEFRKEMNNLMQEDYNKSEAFKLAEKYVSESNGSATPHAYHPYNNQVYSKIGYLVLNNWKYNQPLNKISKNLRISIGLTIFKYIDMEIQKIMSNGKVSRIIVKY